MFFNLRSTLQFIQESQWAPVVSPLKIRTDAAGNGNFNAGRIGHVHQGVDLLVAPGQPVFMPFTGKVVRRAYPYPNSPEWSGLLIEGLGIWSGFSVKIFYMSPLAGTLGKSLAKGKKIGAAQAIRTKYPNSPAMQNHIHLELRHGTKVIDPTEVIFFANTIIMSDESNTSTGDIDS